MAKNAYQVNCSNNLLYSLVTDRGISVEAAETVGLKAENVGGSHGTRSASQTDANRSVVAVGYVVFSVL